MDRKPTRAERVMLTLWCGQTKINVRGVLALAPGHCIEESARA
jgi:hypothetical protein